MGCHATAHQFSRGAARGVLRERAQICRPRAGFGELKLAFIDINFHDIMVAGDGPLAMILFVIEKRLRLPAALQPSGCGFRDDLRDPPGASSAACAVVRTSVGAIN